MDVLDRFTRDIRLLKGFAGILSVALRARGGRPYTVPDAIEAVAAAAPTRQALVFEDRALDYAELEAAANRVARWAFDRGLRRGDVVALLMENRPEFVVCWLGLAKLGVVTALINTNLTGRPLAHSLSVSEARHLILDAALAEHWAGAEDLLETPVEVWSSGGAVAGAEDLDASLLERPGEPLPESLRAGRSSEDKLFYIYTSGTTGLPKAANFSHLRFLTVASGSNAVTGLGETDRVYIPLPLYHTAGGVMALGGALLAGGTAVIARRFSASRFWSDCVRHRATTFQYIGELCRYLLNAPPHADETRHQIRLCVGNGLRPEIWEDFQERFAIPRIVEFYGATEGNVSIVNVDGRVGSVGRLPGWLRRVLGVHLVRFDVESEAVVRGADGHCIECEVGEPGELIARVTSTSRFEGYSDERASEKKLLRDVFEEGDAYFRTGDLLRLDDDGYFYFVDRIGDTFRWKGENVSTGEVALVISRCPGVAEANVYGVEVPGADGRAGMVSLVAGDEFSPERLAQEVQAQLPAYARPVFLRVRAEIEITGTFKHRKVDAVAEGFDPSRISDALFFLDPDRKTYVPLDEALHDRLVEGDLRL